MEPYEPNGPSTNEADEMDGVPTEAPSDANQHPAESAPAPAAPVDTCTCGRPNGQCICGKSEDSSLQENAPPSYVYSIGRIEPRFPLRPEMTWSNVLPLPAPFGQPTSCCLGASAQRRSRS